MTRRSPAAGRSDVSDGLDTILRLVAEGRLTAEEAAPILDALDANDRRSASGSAHPRHPDAGADASPAGTAARVADAGPLSALRIEVREGGRQVVNLRLPIAIGRFAVDRVPGLTGQHADRIREALRHGVRGPIVEVNESDGDSVRLVLE
jgi:hypothetical protein